MKKLKNILTVLMLVFVFLGLWALGRDKDNCTSRTQFLLDTSCSLTFYGKDAEIACDAVFKEISRLEKLMSMYNENSDVSRINRAKAYEKIKVSEDTYRVIETALKISEESDGAFDITIAPITKLWNFTAQEPKIPRNEEIEKGLLAVGYKNIVLGDNHTVLKLKDETKIDLGGIAKGYAGDKAREVAESFDLDGGIIDLGGNIVCFGENPERENKRWTVGIQIPFAPNGTYNKTIEITEGAVVTSGNYQRCFEKNGKLYHHIINPVNGYPYNADYDSVTITQESSLKADCLATAIYVMGEKGESLAKKYNGEVYFEKVEENQ